MGRVQGKGFDPARGLSIASVRLCAPCRSSSWLPWLIVFLTAIKDTRARNKPVPMPIRQRRAPGPGEDALRTYTALHAVYLERCAQVPACAGVCPWCKPAEGAARPGGNPPAHCARAHAPLFVNEDGDALSTQDVKGIGRRMATLAGLGEGAVNAKLWRVGGATDLRDTMGMAGAAVIKERGRWSSDIAFIYARALVGQQMDAAAGMADAGDEEVEAMVAGWVQPAALR